MSFWNLLKVNLKVIYRNQSGLFWTIIMPAFIYIGVSILPISGFIKLDQPYSHYLLPGVLAMQIMQGGIYGLAYWLVDVKSRGVLKRFEVTPISKFELVASLLSARIFIMLAQVVLLTLLGVLLFHVVFVWNVLTLLLFVVLGGCVFLLVGLLIATFADTYESAAPITAGLGLPLTFLGNIFFPIHTLPYSLQLTAKFLPITYLSDGLRKAYLYPFNWASIERDVWVLLVWLVVLFGCVLWRFRLEE